MNTHTDEYAACIIGFGRPGRSNRGEMRLMALAINTASHHNITCDIVRGSWEGVQEYGVVYSATTKTNGRDFVYHCIHLGSLASQDAILFLGNPRSNWHGRPATLATLLKNRVTSWDAIGDFDGVSRETARKTNAWTYAPSLDQHYIVR